LKDHGVVKKKLPKVVGSGKQLTSTAAPIVSPLLNLPDRSSCRVQVTQTGLSILSQYRHECFISPALENINVDDDYDRTKLKRRF
jgi:hypothetical protein